MKKKFLILLTACSLLMGCTLILNADSNLEDAKNAWYKLTAYTLWTNHELKILNETKVMDSQSAKVFRDKVAKLVTIYKKADEALLEKQVFDKLTNQNSNEQNLIPITDTPRIDRTLKQLKSAMKQLNWEENDGEKVILDDIENQKKILMGYKKKLFN